MDGFDNEVKGKGLQAETDFSRRGFMMTSVVAGFTMAVERVEAQTITTDSNGLAAGEVQIPVRDGKIPGYRARPSAKGAYPVVLVVQEIFGVHEHIKDLCRRFAKLGYFAIAPELYARQGDMSKVTDLDGARAVMAKVPDAQVMSDLDDTVRWVQKTGRGDVRHLAITGFCWGGRVVWEYAAHSPQLKAGVAWYGVLSGPTNEMRPKHPLDMVKDLKAPVLGLYGGQDQSIPVADVDKMKEACKAAKKTCDFIVYPDAPHGFNADYRPTYRADAAKDGWAHMLNWFKSHGVAAKAVVAKA
jgi:carboxymethylenebutenolidase